MGFFSEFFGGYKDARANLKASQIETMERAGAKAGEALGGVGPSAVITAPVAATKTVTKATGAVVRKGTRVVGWTAAIAAGIGALAYFTSQSKKSREFDPRNEPLPTPENDAMRVLSADALAGADDKPARAQREVVGPHTAKVLGRTGGLDVTPPNMVGTDGASLVDGKPVQTLGSPSLS